MPNMADLHLAPLTDRALIRLSGPDWRSFLQGLITQDVEILQPGAVRYGALLTPQGRLRWDIFLHGEDDGVVVEVAADARDEVLQTLTLYRLRAKVEIAPDERYVLAAWGDAPAGEDWRADPRLADLGWRRLAQTPEGAGDYRAHRLVLGVADPAQDAVEPLYPIDANLDLLNGIDFKKGCFVGQETTSRMKRRGQIKSRIAPLAYEGPQIEPGAEIMAGDLRAGRVLSGMAGRSLALLRIDRALGADLTALDRTVSLDVPSWLAPAFALEKAQAEA
jgi:folate-binding protein YgfZ